LSFLSSLWIPCNQAEGDYDYDLPAEGDLNANEIRELRELREQRSRWRADAARLQVFARRLLLHIYFEKKPGSFSELYLVSLSYFFLFL
jgi:hypothetical protein